MRKFVLLIMIVLSAGALALAQNKRISGTVKGVDGKPIAGFDLHSGDIMVQFPVQTGGA